MRPALGDRAGSTFCNPGVIGGRAVSKDRPIEIAWQGAAVGVGTLGFVHATPIDRLVVGGRGDSWRRRLGRGTVHETCQT